MNKSLEAQLHELSSRADESSSHVTELEAARDRLTNENGELAQQLEDAESQLSQLSKQKQALTRQMEEIKGSLEEESRTRMKLQTESRNLQVRSFKSKAMKNCDVCVYVQADLDQLRDQLEEELEGKDELQRLLSKANSEAQVRVDIKSFVYSCTFTVCVLPVSELAQEVREWRGRHPTGRSRRSQAEVERASAGNGTAA